jgi:ferric enterobactin receptor
MGTFFDNGLILDESISISGGTKQGSYYLSGSLFDQNGIVPTTGYSKYTFRFNGDQKVGIFTFSASAAYSKAHTDKTLTGAGLYGSAGTGALYALYTWAPSDNMSRYLNDDGTRFRHFADRQDPWDDRDNPYWILNKFNIFDDTDRFTGNLNIRADITDWWNISYKIGIDQYTQVDSKRIVAGSAIKQVFQKGMMSDNTRQYEYMTNSIISDMNKRFGDFDIGLMLGAATDQYKSKSDYLMAYNFSVPDFFSYANTTTDNKAFSHGSSLKRLIGVFGEARASWRNMVYLTVTGRNDWTSTLPLDSRSYFYPSVSGSFVFTQLLQDLNVMDDSILSFGKVRVSWAKVGKDTGVYETATALWPVGTYLGEIVGVGNSWTRGNPYLKPEMTKSTEIGVELSFFKNRLHIDYAYYTNDSFNQILSPRGPQSTGYIFCSINAGNVYNKGMELSISGTPIENRNFRWDVALNMAGNRGTMDGLPSGTDVMYVTDVQYGPVKAASYNGGDFMAIAGYKWTYNKAGNVVIDKNGFPTYNAGTYYAVGNREATFAGGFNNTIQWKGFTFNMLWEFRVGGDVFNGTQYAMDVAGTSQFSADIRNKPLTISGDFQVGTEKDKDGNDIPIYESRSNTWDPKQVYDFNGVPTSGQNIIKNYYTNYYTQEATHYITKVNLLRLRALSVAYEFPKKWMEKTGFIKRASLSLSANNLLLFTNYDGDPEVAVAGAGVGGSSSVGFAYCDVPATSGMTFGLNLTF